MGGENQNQSRVKALRRHAGRGKKKERTMSISLSCDGVRELVLSFTPDLAARENSCLRSLREHGSAFVDDVQQQREGMLAHLAQFGIEPQVHASTQRHCAQPSTMHRSCSAEWAVHPSETEHCSPSRCISIQAALRCSALGGLGQC